MKRYSFWDELPFGGMNIRRPRMSKQGTSSHVFINSTNSKLFCNFCNLKREKKGDEMKKRGQIQTPSKVSPQKGEKESLWFVPPAWSSYDWCTPLSQLKGKLWTAASSMGSGGCLLQLGSSSFRKDWQRWSCQPRPLDPESLPPASASTQVLKGSIWPWRWGLPSLPASFWADLKVCIPGLENLPYPKSRLKPAAAFQALPSNPAIHTRTRTRTHSLTRTHTCSRTSFDIKKSLELLSCSPKHKANFTYSAFPTLSLGSINRAHRGCGRWTNRR